MLKAKHVASRGRTWLVAVVVFAVQPMATVSTAAEPSIVGVWRTIDDRDGRPRALVQITSERDAFTGRIVGSLRGEPQTLLCTKCLGELRNVPLKNLAVLTGLRRTSTLNFDGGRILDPDTGQIVDARADLAPDGRSLVMRGYLGFSLFGRSQRWERVQ